MTTPERVIDHLELRLDQVQALVDLAAQYENSPESIETAMYLAHEYLTEIKALLDGHWMDLTVKVPCKD